MESIFLPKFTIERCRQCGDDGWGLCRDEGRCVIDDDLASIFEKIKKAEAVVFATPVYFWDLSESMRAFTDRMRRICRKGGRSKEIEGKPVVDADGLSWQWEPAFDSYELVGRPFRFYFSMGFGFSIFTI